MKCKTQRQKDKKIHKERTKQIKEERYGPEARIRRNIIQKLKKISKKDGKQFIKLKHKKA